MKEAIHSPYNKLVFRETFNSEQETRKRGTPTDVTFANGKGTFNGTSSKVNYNLGLNGTYSVRVRCNPTSFSDYRSLLTLQTGYVYLNLTDGTVQKSSGKVYVNGVASSSTTVGIENEVVVTGIELIEATASNKTLIGSNLGDDNEFLGTIDLVEIYSGTLTPSEVSNLYNDRWNTELPPTTPREVTQFSCDTTDTGWQRCADDSGTNTGGTYGVGKSLKAVGIGSGVGAGNDLVGFAATLPGARYTNASFNDLGSNLYLWSSTPSSASNAWSRTLYTSYSTVYRHAYGKASGFSVRCLRDTDDTSDFTDPRDGTVYQCVRIGTQVWMTKNLAYLPSVNEVADGSDSVAKYYVYGYDGTDVATAKATSNYTDYGVLYNYPAAIISAPTGFHVPSDEELNVLELATLEVIAETAGDGLMTILNNGNVGIGTANPGYKLEIVGSGSSTDVLKLTKGTGTGGILFAFDEAGTYPSSIRTYESGSSAGYMQFKVNTGLSTTAEIMRLQADGNVGIGTTNPSEKLDVNGNIKATQFKLSDLNTAPASATATGTKGEIRVTADAIYICSATDTWVKADLATF